MFDIKIKRLWRTVEVADVGTIEVSDVRGGTVDVFFVWVGFFFVWFVVVTVLPLWRLAVLIAAAAGIGFVVCIIVVAAASVVCFLPSLHFLSPISIS